jgi:flagellar biosynthesis protein FlhF
MRLKNFQAPTMAEAMELVRESLGANAIIVSTNEDEATSGVRITAAIEQEDPDTFLSTEPTLDLIEVIGEALDRNGAPAELHDQILSSVSLLNEQEPAVALSSALDLAFSFKPLGERENNRPLLFFGPPGGGKTVTIAKRAVCAMLNQDPVTLITTDTLRAGAVEQFKNYGERLGIIACVADDPEKLIDFVNQADSSEQVLIDTTSTNPFSEVELARLIAFSSAVDAETILVLPGMLDALEAHEVASAFSALHSQRLVTTCLDIVGRLGAMLTVAHAHNLALGDIGTSPVIANGLKPLNPVSLAQLLLSDSVRNTILEYPKARNATQQSHIRWFLIIY